MYMIIKMLKHSNEETLLGVSKKKKRLITDMEAKILTTKLFLIKQWKIIQCDIINVLK